MAKKRVPLRKKVVVERRSPTLFGLRVLEGMRRADISKAELARRIDKPWRTVHEWIVGGQNPGMENVKLLARELPMTLEELLGVAAGQNPPYNAWLPFLETEEGKSMNEAERRALQAFDWADDVPSVADYVSLLNARRGPKVRQLFTRTEAAKQSE